MDTRRPVAGSVEPGHVERDVEDDPGLHHADARNRRNARRHGFRRPLEGREDVGKSVVGVVTRLRGEQRIVRGARGDEHRHATGHHEADGEHLAAQVEQIAQQLASERGHERLTIAAPTAGHASRCAAPRRSHRCAGE